MMIQKVILNMPTTCISINLTSCRFFIIVLFHFCFYFSICSSLDFTEVLKIWPSTLHVCPLHFYCHQWVTAHSDVLICCNFLLPFQDVSGYHVNHEISSWFFWFPRHSLLVMLAFPVSFCSPIITISRESCNRARCAHKSEPFLCFL